MILAPQTPKKVLKAFLKQKPLRREIDQFKTHLISLLDKLKVIEQQPKDESEEHLKNNLRDFLRDTYYRDTNSINTKDKKDLVVHLGKSTNSEVGVIIEAKRPSNTGEMVTADNPNKKALHELILYYFDERNEAGNNQLKHLIITNVQEWFILDANLFDKHIYRNPQLKKLYDTKRNDKKDNPWFYEEVSKVIAKMDIELSCTYFDIREYNTILRNNNKEDDRNLSALYKIFAPQYLLKIASTNDSNALNEKFYKELLYIIGLEEAKEGSKNIIRRKKEGKNPASLIELTMDALLTEDVLHRLPDASIYGANKEERAFNVALELGITWINRILFLKLLEGQLLAYHQDNNDYRFLNTGMIYDFDELFNLFHKVMAVNVEDRTEVIQHKYGRVPYLNSSLFEISELEDQTIKINSLNNRLQLEMIGTSVLKDPRKKSAKLSTLAYLFEFLDAYDFASEGTEDLQEEHKSIINASVLGKVFEKINGYKDGSIFTPAFITMYMCRQSVRLAVLQKFNESLGAGTFEKYEDLNNYLGRLFKTQDILKANEIINSLRICDPAVGSGHFLVSSLNEIICIKAELGILADKDGNRIHGYEIEIINDELIITDPRNRDSTLEYRMSGGKPVSKEVQRLQKLLFHEKQTIIENCLFGVDINPNSVKICRLRLWIELLKNAYYREESNFTELETLPNIDINIKCGNSLISRFDLRANLSNALKSIKYDIKAYRGFVQDYKNEKSREVKRGLQKIIDGIKSDFRTEISKNDPKQLRLFKINGELYNLMQPQIFKLSSKETKANRDKQIKLESEIQKLSTEIEEIKSNAIYKNAFEWRFEFPEVLNNAGEFEGFDVVIANPPYVFARENFTASMKNYFIQNYNTSQYQVNLFLLFIERSIPLLKKNGQFSMIVPNSLLMVSSAQRLRKHLLEQIALTEIINLMGNTFEGINVETVIISGKKENKERANKIAILINQGTNFLLLHSKEQQLFMQNEGCELTVFSDAETDKIIAKLKVESGILDDLVNIKAGLKAYEANKGNPRQSPEDVKSRPFDYLYKFDENTYKYLEGKDVGRYCLKWSGTYLKYGEHLAAPRAFEIFNGNKIIIREITGKFPHSIVATYTEEVFLFNMSNIAIIEKESRRLSLKYILAILNSTLMSYYFINNTAKSVRQLFPKLILEDLRKFPIKNISATEQKPFISLVDQILVQKQLGQDTTSLEREVDTLVYCLYGVNEEEQRLIKGERKETVGGDSMIYFQN